MRRTELCEAIWIANVKYYYKRETYQSENATKWRRRRRRQTRLSTSIYADDVETVLGLTCFCCRRNGRDCETQHLLAVANWRARFAVAREKSKDNSRRDFDRAQAICGRKPYRFGDWIKRNFVSRAHNHHHPRQHATIAYCKWIYACVRYFSLSDSV